MWAASSDTRVITLIPIAIAINIVLGETVQQVLKLPIYLDSIGTILVGVLAGPIPAPRHRRLDEPRLDLRPAGAVPQRLRGPFAITAAWIGFFAGVVAQLRLLPQPTERLWGRLRDRRRRRRHPRARRDRLLRVHPYNTDGTSLLQTRTATRMRSSRSSATIIGLPSSAIVVGSSSCWPAPRSRRGRTWPIAGLICGIVAAFISAPIAAIVFGGVTGSGDGPPRGGVPAGRRRPLPRRSSSRASSSDPIDKTIDLLRRLRPAPALSRRFVARFPQGEKAVGLEEA